MIKKQSGLKYSIGDWVYIDNKPMQIKSIDIENRYLDKNDNPYTEDEVFPITLTENMMVLNGFVRDPYTKNFKLRDNLFLGVELGDKETPYYQFDITDSRFIVLKYVHNLQ